MIYHNDARPDDGPATSDTPDPDERITRLARDATSARNTGLAMLCRAALRGDVRARERVTRILAHPGMHEWEIPDDEADPPDEFGTPGSDTRHRDDLASNIKHPEVEVKLTGTNGNIYAVIGKVREAMRRAGIPAQEITAFTTAVTNSGSYDRALATVMEWVDVA